MLVSALGELDELGVDVGRVDVVGVGVSGVGVSGVGVSGVGVLIDGLGPGALGSDADENVCGGWGTLGAGDGGGGAVAADPGAAAKPSVVDRGLTAVAGVGSAVVPAAMGGWSTPTVPGVTDPSTAGRGSVVRGVTPEVSCPRNPTAIPPVVAAMTAAPVPISIDDFPNRDLDRCRPAIAAPFCVVQTTYGG